MVHLLLSEKNRKIHNRLRVFLVFYLQKNEYSKIKKESDGDKRTS